MKLYVVRHGESVTNLQKCWSGWYDAPLTEQGRRDALFAGEVLSGVTFDRVFASDLSRAMDTAKIALPGVECQATPLLREINVGSIATRPYSENPVPKDELGRNNYASYGGETQDAFFKRVGDFMQEVATLDAENVAAFSHAGVLRAMMTLAIGQIIPFDHILCQNCALAIFEYINGTWKLHSWINPNTSAKSACFTGV